MIDFVASLYNIGTRYAAVKLAEDFGISYDTNPYKHDKSPVQKPVPALTFQQKYEQMKTKCIRVLLDYLNLLRNWKERYAPKEADEIWHPLFCEALQEITHIEYLLDILLFGEIEEQAAVIAEQGRRLIELEERIREFISIDEVEPVRDNEGDGAGTDSRGNPGDAGVYTERRCEKQSA